MQAIVESVSHNNYYRNELKHNVWQSQVHYPVSGLVISLEGFIEITPDFLISFELHLQ